MYKLLVRVLVFLALLSSPIPARSLISDGDLLLASDSATLPPNGFLIVNLTLERNTGYYGSYDCSGLIKFGIVKTSGLDSYLAGVYDDRLYEESNTSQTRWEYPCDVNVNASFVYKSLVDSEVTLEYEIYQDSTPIEVFLNFSWIANYPPKLEISANFTGGFFQSASGTIYPLGSNESYRYGVFFNSNGTDTWTAGEYPYRKGRFDEYPDGEYNLTLRVLDVFDEETNRYYPFTKNTQRNSIMIILGLMGIFAIAFGVEQTRRRFVN
jgi:hypothetical protein